MSEAKAAVFIVTVLGETYIYGKSSVGFGRT